MKKLIAVLLICVSSFAWGAGQEELDKIDEFLYAMVERSELNDAMLAEGAVSEQSHAWRYALIVGLIQDALAERAEIVEQMGSDQQACPQVEQEMCDYRINPM